MILGMSTATYTLIHVLISLAGLLSGFVVLFGLISGRRFNGWTAVFLATTVATSVTGFGFPFEHVTPGIIVGIISMVVLVIAILARYSFHLHGGWGRTYVIAACFALYLNFFVAVAQAFQKIPALKALAPTQSEPPFAVTQLIVLAGFIVLGVLATRRYPRLAAVPA